MLALLADPDMTRERFVAAFLEEPLRNTAYAQGFGTLYTAAYYPAEGRAEYRWPGCTWRHSLAGFTESEHAETFAEERAGGLRPRRGAVRRGAARSPSAPRVRRARPRAPRRPRSRARWG